MGKSTPAVPDPVATANAQGAANVGAARESARLNRTETYGPGVHTSWSNPDEYGVPATQNVQLGAPEQRAYNAAVLNAGIAGEKAGDIIANNMGNDVERINLAGLPQLFSADFGATRGGADGPGAEALQRTEDATYRRYARTLDPEQEAARRANDVMLDTRGIPLGGEAWLKAQDRIDRSQNTQRQDARDAAVGAGNAFQNQLFNQSAAARQMSYGQQAAERTYKDQTIAQRLASLIGIGQGGIPSAAGQQTAQMSIAPVDVAGINQGNYGARSANAASENQAKTQAAGAATAIAVSALSAY